MNNSTKSNLYWLNLTQINLIDWIGSDVSFNRCLEFVLGLHWLRNGTILRRVRRQGTNWSPYSHYKICRPFFTFWNIIFVKKCPKNTNTGVHDHLITYNWYGIYNHITLKFNKKDVICKDWKKIIKIGLQYWKPITNRKDYRGIQWTLHTKSKMDRNFVISFYKFLLKNKQTPPIRSKTKLCSLLVRQECQIFTSSVYVSFTVVSFIFG